MWIPESLAYKGHDPRGMLVFDVELIELPLRPPVDLKTPPLDATRTQSGLAYKVLRAGTGRRPFGNSQVTVNYTGWTTDGEMFESTYTKAAPVTIPITKVIAGWKEGLPLMAEGGKTRFWIPERLAYRGIDPPYGALVFDIELVKTTP
jgi:peptidylprolyl isomerase